MLTVRHGTTTDTIAVAPEPGRAYRLGDHLTCDATVAVVSRQNGQRIFTFAAGGSQMVEKDVATAIPATISGEIRAVDYRQQRIVVENVSTPVKTDGLQGCAVRIHNERHSCMYIISSARFSDGRLTLELTGSDLRTGRVRMASVDPAKHTVLTKTRVLYPFNLAGMHLATDDLRHTAPIVSMDKGVIQLSDAARLEPFAADLDKPEARDAWAVDFGVGDRIEIERFVYQSSR